MSTQTSPPTEQEEIKSNSLKLEGNASVMHVEDNANGSGDSPTASDCGQNQQTPSDGDDGNSPLARISYIVEYRGQQTNDLIREQTAKEMGKDDMDHGEPSSDAPVFEVVTIFKVPESTEPESSAPPPVPTHTAPSYLIRIRSPAIIHALQSVVQYYPDEDLTSYPIVISWPYPILVHHYDELREFIEICAEKDPSERCVKETGACEHLGLLMDFLDTTIMDQVNEEKERNKRGFYTFEWAWVAWKPGTTLLQSSREEVDVWRGCVVRSISGGSFQSPPTDWRLCRWRLTYDGTYLGRVPAYFTVYRFDGELEFTRDTRVIDEDDYTDEIAAANIRCGETYWELLKKQCKYYKGRTTSFPYNEVDGLVMADLVSYFEREPYGKPVLMDTSDLRNWASDCACVVCENRSKDQIISLFEEYNAMTVDDMGELTPHMYLLCPIEIPAYVFRTRTWEHLQVAHFSEPQFNENLINNLVMDESRLKTLKALAKSFSRLDKSGSPMKRGPWSADFIKGKGSGLIFLLHGRPGVGKTCTAEYIAEFINRPLMTLTCSDIGTEPRDVEYNLTKNFKTATSWGAVLLIDEADVFMERRSTADLNRNSLVAGFLRALEFYDGILFLTTNRVGAFDDAFVSRVHVQIYYPDFTDEQRQLVWKTFIDKLATERGDYMRLNIDAKEYIRGSEMRELEWNGREIKNAFQTAVALAEFDGQQDEENKIVLTDSHLRAVVELSRDFKQYLDDLHRGDEGKRAERKVERLDSYGAKQR